jgi:preprotein translocase subunit SecA
MSVEPVLTAFFQYLNDMAHIKNASKLIEALKEAAPIMVEEATDSSNWGFAKQFVMTAMNEGVDIEDKQAMDKFTQQYNARITSSQTVPAPQIANSMPKVGRNEPCPCGSGKKFKKCCIKNA